MKYLLTIFLLLASYGHSKEVEYMYYSDPLQVMDHYNLKDCYKTCRRGYEHTGDVYSHEVKCWCERWKVLKLKILNEWDNENGRKSYIVTRDCEYAWIVYSDDVHIIKIETERE